MTTTISIQAVPAGSGYAGPSQNEGTPALLGIGQPASSGTQASFLFVISRSGDVSAAQSVSYAVTGSGANPASAGDFPGGLLPGGTITFDPGVTFLVLTVPALADFQPEPDQGFTVTLSNPTGGATIGAATASALILNDDVATQTGTAGNDTIDQSASAAPVFIDVSQGGNDTVTGGSGNDIFYFGGAFTAADIVRGGAGQDTLVLDGNYTTKTKLGPNTLSGIENIFLADGNNYDLTLNKQNAPAGNALTVDASTILSNHSTIIDGRPVAGALTFLGGAGINWFFGGGGNDTFNGGPGADLMNGGKGVNTFIYNSYGTQSGIDSPLVVTAGVINTSFGDTLQNFHGGIDKIDLSSFFPGSATASVTSKATAGYSSNIGAGVGFFGSSNVVVEYSSKSKSADARIYVDVNGDGNLTTGDMVITATKVGFGRISAADFVS